MLLEGVDFSGARPGGAALAAAGKHFVLRYLWDQAGGGLTNAEIADYQAHGLGIGVGYESGRGDATKGYAMGVAHATLAQSRLEALNLPHDLPLWFAVDQNVPWGAVVDYFHGTQSIVGTARNWVYGGKDVIEGAMQSGVCGGYWQTYAWSDNVIVDGINMLQYLNGQTINGGLVDYVRAYQDNYGQLPVGQTPDDNDWIDMKTDAEIIELMQKAVAEMPVPTDPNGSPGITEWASAVLGRLYINSQAGTGILTDSTLWPKPGSNRESLAAVVLEMQSTIRQMGLTLNAIATALNNNGGK